MAVKESTPGMEAFVRPFHSLASPLLVLTFHSNRATSWVNPLRWEGRREGRSQDSAWGAEERDVGVLSVDGRTYGRKKQRKRFRFVILFSSPLLSPCSTPTRDGRSRSLLSARVRLVAPPVLLPARRLTTSFKAGLFRSSFSLRRRLRSVPFRLLPAPPSSSNALPPTAPPAPNAIRPLIQPFRPLSPLSLNYRRWTVPRPRPGAESPARNRGGVGQ